MCCTEAIARILVFVANVACLLVAIALIGLGVYTTVNVDSDYFQGIPEEYQVVHYVPTLAIILGAVVFAISFLGCCGTLRSNACMLSAYAIALIVIFLLQVALGIYGLVTIEDTGEFEGKINGTVTHLFDRYGEGKSVAGIVDLIQQKLECCGPDSSRFWGAAIPDSCYKNNSNVVFTKGCSSELYDLIMGSVKIIGIIALVVSVVEVMGAVLALYLKKTIRSKKVYA